MFINDRECENDKEDNIKMLDKKDCSKLNFRKGILVLHGEFYFFLLCIFFNFNGPLKAESIRCDISSGFWVVDESYEYNGDYREWAYTRGAPSFEISFQYLRYKKFLTPYVTISYKTNFPRPSIELKLRSTSLNSTHLLITTGLSKTFYAGYSEIGLMCGFGYDWAKYSIFTHGDSFFKDYNNFAYLIGVNIYFPFLEKVKSLIGYRLLVKDNKIIELNDQDRILKVDNFYHLITIGVSFDI